MTTEAMRLHPDLAGWQATEQATVKAPAVRAVEGLTFLTGLYLAISPWVVGFNRFTTLTANDLIIGIALAVLALGFGSAVRRSVDIAWVAPLIGIWTIIASWVVRGDVATTATIWSNVVTGAVAVLLGLGVIVLRISRTR
ncbi:MAG: SPW repeat protein [Pseudonocardiales bacterium]|nr:SPW repeat protein [Pseudonocardiales bacterium]